MEILVLGDTHGDTVWTRGIVRKARKLGITRIIQCGDFGLWDHKEDGIRFLDTVNEECRAQGVKLYWLDGNHENHDRLEWYQRHNPRTHNGHVFIRSHVLYSPRGNRWNWGDKWFMTVGGAVSIDKAYRTIGQTWWQGEQLSDRDVHKIEQSADKTDFLFTHDCSTASPFRHRLKNDPESQIHRQRMDKVAKAVRPKLWFHGHMHEKYEWMFPLDYSAGNWAQVYGLEMNGDFWSWGVLNTETEAFTWGPSYKQ